MPEILPEIPLTEATFIILLSLADGPKHGYAILKDAHALSQGRIRFSTGTLYGGLNRLLERGWIERLDLDIEERPGRLRKEYRLTERGRMIIQAEVSRMNSLVQAARHRSAWEGL
jgi:DNA-binding PadR family transcriptional regulator